MRRNCLGTIIGASIRSQSRNYESGMCSFCIVGCPVPYEIGMSAIRGREAIYHRPRNLVRQQLLRKKTLV